MHYATPEGLERLLRLAAAHEDFARELIVHRGKLSAAAKISMSPTERAMLDSLSDGFVAPRPCRPALAEKPECLLVF